MDTDVRAITTTQMDAGVPDVSIAAQTLDVAGPQPETYWTNPDWTKNLGYFTTVPEFKEPTRAIARWTVGKGFTTDNATQVRLDKINGWGEDSFQSIME